MARSTAVLRLKAPSMPSLLSVPAVVCWLHPARQSRTQYYTPTPQVKRVAAATVLVSVQCPKVLPGSVLSKLSLLRAGQERQSPARVPCPSAPPSGLLAALVQRLRASPSHPPSCLQPQAAGVRCFAPPLSALEISPLARSRDARGRAPACPRPPAHLPGALPVGPRGVPLSRCH